MSDYEEFSFSSSNLDDNERLYISDMFYEEKVPKLIKLGARLGVVNCRFAGEEYKNWNIRFRSAGSDFEIIDFYYDEASSDMDWDL